MADEYTGDYPAFPCSHPQAQPFPGMTLRDWFAGQALAGLLADPNITENWSRISRKCYDMADAMFEARKPQEQD